MSFPHACGDGPATGAIPSIERKFSPRVWGWSGNSYSPVTARGLSYEPKGFKTPRLIAFPLLPILPECVV